MTPQQTERDYIKEEYNIDDYDEYSSKEMKYWK